MINSILIIIFICLFLYKSSKLKEILINFEKLCDEIDRLNKNINLIQKDIDHIYQIYNKIYDEKKYESRKHLTPFIQGMDKITLSKKVQNHLDI